ncbi:MAG: hypothetical protein ABSD39_21520 [Terriglobales bacterium]
MALSNFVYEAGYENGIRVVRLVEAVDGSAERRRLIAQREIELGRRRMPNFVVGIQL